MKITSKSKLTKDTHQIYFDRFKETHDFNDLQKSFSSQYHSVSEKTMLSVKFSDLKTLEFYLSDNKLNVRLFDRNYNQQFKLSMNLIKYENMRDWIKNIYDPTNSDIIKKLKSLVDF